MAKQETIDPSTVELPIEDLQERYTRLLDAMSAAGRTAEAAAIRRFLRAIATFKEAMDQAGGGRFTLYHWEELAAKAKLNAPSRRDRKAPDFNDLTGWPGIHLRPFPKRQK